MPKQLADFLQEQQEPFALEAYLLERGYSKHLPNCSAKSAPPNCSDFLRCVFSHSVLANARNRRIAITENKNAAQDGSSQTSSTSESSAEDSRRLSPISVLDEDEDSSIHYKYYKFKAQEQHSNSRRNSSKESQKLNHYDHYIMNKKALEHGKELMIDCRREVRERKMGEMGDEDVWEYVRIWSQYYISESNMVLLLHSQFLASIDEWRCGFEQGKLEVSMEIENVILEDVINEIIIC